MYLSTYNVRQAEVCFLGCLADIIKYQGIDVSEEMLLGLGSGLQFRLQKRSIEGLSLSARYSLDCVDLKLDRESYTNLFSKLGVVMEDIQSKSAQDCISRVINELEHNIPVMLEVDTYYLEYHPEHMIKHNAHTIVVYGFNPITQEVEVADNLITGIEKRKFNGTVSVRSLGKALNLCETDAKYKYFGRRITVEENGRCVSSDQVIESIKNSSLLMLNTTGTQEVSLGVSGICELADILEVQSRKDFCDDVKGLLENFHVMLIGFGGPVSTRKLYASFLEGTNQLQNDAEDSLISESYLELSNKWRIAATVLLKAAMTEKTTYIERAAKRIREIAKEEARLARELIEKYANEEATIIV